MERRRLSQRITATGTFVACAVYVDRFGYRHDARAALRALGEQARLTESSKVDCRMMVRQEQHWAWFFAWALPGTCFALGVTAIGAFTVPVGAVAAIALWRKAKGPQALGLLLGVGSVGLYVGAYNLGRHHASCTANSESGRLGPGQTTHVASACGGVSGLSWLIVGGLLIVTGLLLYRHATRPAFGQRSTPNP